MHNMTDEETLRRISAALKKFRKEQNLSKYEVARRAGTYPINIKRIEDQMCMPGVGLLTRIAQAMGRETVDFLQPVRRSRARTRKTTLL